MTLELFLQINRSLLAGWFSPYYAGESSETTVDWQLNLFREPFPLVVSTPTVILQISRTTEGK